MVCWLAKPDGPRPQVPDPPHHARESKAMVAGIEYRLDINTMEWVAADKLARTTSPGGVQAGAAGVLRPYADNRGTGAFIVIDESNNNTVGAGMIPPGLI